MLAEGLTLSTLNIMAEFNLSFLQHNKDEGNRTIKSRINLFQKCRFEVVIYFASSSQKVKYDKPRCLPLFRGQSYIAEYPGH